MEAHSNTSFTYLMLALILLLGSCSDDEDIYPVNPADMPYTVTVDPSNFVTEVTGNDYFPIKPNSFYIYLGEDEEGTEIRVEERYTTDTRIILGVTCAVVQFKEFEDGELVEETYDWYAQDVDGNVWYFGEDSNDIEGGQVVSTAGSWEAGVDGALPGIIMFEKPQIGVWYRQEYYKNEAEDVAQILNFDGSISTPYGQFENCLVAAEWSPLEPGIVENKYYAPGIGLVHVEKVEGTTGFESLSEYTQ